MTEADITTLNEAIATLAAGGADAIVLACTEFSLIPDKLSSPLPIVDSLQVLSDRIVNVVKSPDH